MEFRDMQVLCETNREMQANLARMQNIASENQRESEVLASIAKQGQKDSMTFKALTLIATIYLPASLAAVRYLTIYFLSFQQ